MQTEVICTAITAVATMVCSALGVIVSKRSKEQLEFEKRSEERANARAKEGKLNLAMLNANSQLTCSIAEALRDGKCNGNVTEGLKVVREAQREYTEFLESIAIEKIMK